jgi:hypothetical protein
MRFSVFYNPVTEKGVIMDTFAIRMFRMRMRLTAWAEIVKGFQAEHETRMVMILLTYRKVEDYRPGHINDFMRNLKQRLNDNLLAFAWVAEIQKRGAVHYHLVLVVNKGTRIPLPDKSGMWKHGLSGIHTARTPYYLLTYVGKEYQKDLARYPKHCRIYAASIRFGGDDTKALFRVLAGLELSSEGGEVSGDVEARKEGRFLFVGNAISYDYAKTVLMPSGAVVRALKQHEADE